MRTGQTRQYPSPVGRHTPALPAGEGPAHYPLLLKEVPSLEEMPSPPPVSLPLVPLLCVLPCGQLLPSGPLPASCVPALASALPLVSAGSLEPLVPEQAEPSPWLVPRSGSGPFWVQPALLSCEAAPDAQGGHPPPAPHRQPPPVPSSLHTQTVWLIPDIPCEYGPDYQPHL